MMARNTPVEGIASYLFPLDHLGLVLPGPDDRARGPLRGGWVPLTEGAKIHSIILAPWGVFGFTQSSYRTGGDSDGLGALNHL